MLLHTLHGVELATKKWQPRAWTVAMLVGVAVNEVEQALVVLVFGEVDLALKPSLWCTVDGEHVDIDAAEIAQVHTLDESS